MISVGTDILRVERIDGVLERLGERFVERILTPGERLEFEASNTPGRLLAKRFAAKEAIAKALGTGIGRGVSWQDIHLDHDEHGAPRVRLSGGAEQAARDRGGRAVHISLADEAEYVVAFAVLVP